MFSFFSRDRVSEGLPARRANNFFAHPRCCLWSRVVAKRIVFHTDTPAWLGNFFVGSVTLFFWASLFVQRLDVFQNPLERAAASSVAIGMIALTMILVRHGSFQPRRVVEFQLPTEPMGQATFNLVAGGKAWRSRVTLRYRDDAQQSFDGADGTVQNYRALTRAEFDFISAHIHESKIRAHEVTPEGDSEPLLLIVHMITGRQKPSIDLRAYAENAVVAMNAAAVRGVIGP